MWRVFDAKKLFGRLPSYKTELPKMSYAFIFNILYLIKPL